MFKKINPSKFGKGINEDNVIIINEGGVGEGAQKITMYNFKWCVINSGGRESMQTVGLFHTTRTGIKNMFTILLNVTNLEDGLYSSRVCMA